jgi:outer membrane protein OmpA-like peptidoglycan-associated protein
MKKNIKNIIKNIIQSDVNYSINLLGLGFILLGTACNYNKDVSTKSFTDGAIYRDQKVLNDTFSRIEKLNTNIKNNNITLDQYHLAKSNAWWELARDEYQLNNRLPIVEESLAQSHELLTGLEQQKILTLDTPITKSSQLARPDLWEKAQQWKKGTYFKCYTKPLAELEVQLVAVGHQVKNFGFRHAQPYILKAERLEKDIINANKSCQLQAENDAKLALLETEKQKNEQLLLNKQQEQAQLEQKKIEELKTFDVVAVAYAPIDLKKSSNLEQTMLNVQKQLQEILVDRIHFDTAQTKIQLKSAAVLDRVVAILKKYPDMIVGISGFTDTVGDATKNKILSKNRAIAVQTYLLSSGIPSSQMQIAYFGENNLQVNQQGAIKDNRRVVIRPLQVKNNKQIIWQSKMID